MAPERWLVTTRKHGPQGGTKAGGSTGIETEAEVGKRCLVRGGGGEGTVSSTYHEADVKACNGGDHLPSLQKFLEIARRGASRWHAPFQFWVHPCLRGLSLS